MRPALAAGMVAAAVDVRSFFDRFARRAAIFSFADLARAVRMRAFLGVGHKALLGPCCVVPRALAITLRVSPRGGNTGKRVGLPAIRGNCLTANCFSRLAVAAHCPGIGGGKRTEVLERRSNLGGRKANLFIIGGKGMVPAERIELSA